MGSRVERALAVVGAATLLVVGYDGVTYAATGSSLILGHTNRAGAATTLQNTGTGAALSLVTSRTSYPPFTTNARGLVTNLNAQYLGGRTLSQVESRATAVNGLTAAQIEAAARTGVDAATVNGQTAAQIEAAARSGVDAATVNGQSAAQIESAARTNVDAATLGGQTLSQVEQGATALGGRSATDILDALTCAGAPRPDSNLSFPLTNQPFACDFVGIAWPGVMLYSSNLTADDFEAANLSGGNLSNARLRSSRFYAANLTGTSFYEADLTGADLTNANLTGGNVQYANLTNVNFTRADLQGVSTSGAVVTGAVWNDTICPTGVNSNNNLGTCVGQGF